MVPVRHDSLPHSLQIGLKISHYSRAPIAERSPKTGLVLIGSRTGGGASELSQARPCSHWLHARGGGAYVGRPARSGSTEFVNEFMIFGTSVHSPYDYFLSTCYKLAFFFYKHLF